jgi:hypothetical protein
MVILRRLRKAVVKDDFLSIAVFVLVVNALVAPTSFSCIVEFRHAIIEIIFQTRGHGSKNKETIHLELYDALIVPCLCLTPSFRLAVLRRGSKKTTRSERERERERERATIGSLKWADVGEAGTRIREKKNERRNTHQSCV